MIRKVSSTKSMDMIFLPAALGSLARRLPHMPVHVGDKSGHQLGTFECNALQRGRLFRNRSEPLQFAACYCILQLYALAKDGFFFQFSQERSWMNSQNPGSLGFVVPRRAENFLNIIFFD